MFSDTFLSIDVARPAMTKLSFEVFGNADKIQYLIFVLFSGHYILRLVF